MNPALRSVLVPQPAPPATGSRRPAAPDLPLNGFVAIADETTVVRDLIRPALVGRHESLVLLGFDARDCLSGWVRHSENTAGTVNWPGALVRDVIRDGRSITIQMAHNHPSGNPQPSGADLRLTRQIAQLLELVDMHLSDHLVLTGHGHFSFRRAGLI